MTYRNCPDCQEYAERRRPVLVPEMARVREKTGETSERILDRYMQGVHARHLAGGSL